MPIINTIATWWIKKRIHQMALFKQYPIDVQEDGLRTLITKASKTVWGKKYDYASIHNYQHFVERVPLQGYEDVKPWIEKLRRGEKHLLWPGETKWFAKSSGTTNDKSKYIPVTLEALEENHFNGGRDMVALYCENVLDTNLFVGKNISLAGSYRIEKNNHFVSYQGDLSAIVIQNLPFLANILRAPDVSIALMDGWEHKLELMAKTTLNENITSLAGVPSWMLVFLKRVLELKGVNYINQVWPSLEVFFHGGIAYGPYKCQFENLWEPGFKPLNRLELYNASEGFFGIQDHLGEEDMLLMLDYDIFYEFIPRSNTGNLSQQPIPLREVQLNQNYAMVISTSAGLWRYQIGDTIRFTSLLPYRFKITGRTKHFINAFGEELMIENADKALNIACSKTHATIKDYTVAPVFMENNQAGFHQWLIEFDNNPFNLDYFSEVLDNALKSLNSDYEAKRYHNFVIGPPMIVLAKPGLFYDWLKGKNKTGGQNKIPRLVNDRSVMDDLLKLNLLAICLFLAAIVNSVTAAQVLKEINVAASFIEVDQSSNIYSVDHNKLTKYDPVGNVELTFSDKSGGQITGLDVTNPMKIIVCYSDFNRIILLDNFLSPLAEPIQLENLGVINGGPICASFDNGFWVYNHEQTTIERYGPTLLKSNNSNSLFAITGEIPKVNFMRESFNYLYINEAARGILVFDIYGNYLKTIPIVDLCDFQIIDNKIFFVENGGQIGVFDLTTKTHDNIKLPCAEKLLEIRKTKNSWVLLTAAKIILLKL